MANWQNFMSPKHILYSVNIFVSMLIFICSFSFVDAVSRNIMIGLGELGTDLYIISDNQYLFSQSKNPLTKQTAFDIEKKLGPDFIVAEVNRSYKRVTSSDGKSMIIAIWETSTEFFDIIPLHLTSGELFTTFDERVGSKVCILSDYLSTNLFNNINMNNANRLMLDKTYCDQIGISSPKVFIPEYTMSDNIYVPLGFNIPEGLASKHPLTEIFVKQISSKTPQGQTADIEELLKTLTEKSINPRIDIWSSETFFANRNQISTSLKLLIWVIAIVIVTLASIGIANSLSIDVIERKGEIGLRTAIGATPHDIFKLFMINGIKVVLTGGGLGIIAGPLLVHYFISPTLAQSGLLPVIDMTINIFVISITFAVLLLAALIASIIPARKALKIDASIAIRNL
ncbi:MAG: ABC transporter permease [Emcibacteraceae bacterium]|nr:ABC transporter permease [Emcibacteraceae bacterium]